LVGVDPGISKFNSTFCGVMPSDGRVLSICPGKYTWWSYVFGQFRKVEV